jgi:uncharacterized protein (DUF885 family)
MYKAFRLSLLIAVGFVASPVHADANGDLKILVEDYWQDVLKTSPIFASSLGDDRYANEVGDVTLAASDRWVLRATGFLKRLDAVPVDQLDDASKVEAGILHRSLSEGIEGNNFGQRAINFTNRSGWHQSFAGMADNLPFRNAADYRSYNIRLKQYAKVNDDSIAVANVAIKGKYTLPCVSLDGYEKSISGLIAKDERQSRFFDPYKGKKPDTVSEEDWNGLASQAISTINAVINPALQKQLYWYVKSYKPACAKAPGVSAQPNGAAYYAYRIKQETTTNYNAEQIHQIGLGEVTRIRALMDKLATTSGFKSREAMIGELRSNTKYYAKTPEELMEKVARINKNIDGKMPTLFHKLARLPYGIREIPAETAEGTTTAYYSPGSPNIGISGTYYVNTSKLDQRPLWEIPALSAHEAVPGHHHQIALQQELPLSEFRKNGAFFTAFVEGWGLYSESLGEEMGIYDTPEKKMGRLSYEMWRACRLVVDTGIHAKGWTKAQAIQFMKDNTALTDANIEAEVNRYISWPGQALAYKLGELKIKELRGFASKELGAKFDLAAFHDVILGQGAVPLEVLDAQVKDWISAVKAKK